jgi:hypothetical protein
MANALGELARLPSRGAVAAPRELRWHPSRKPQIGCDETLLGRAPFHANKKWAKSTTAMIPEASKRS